MKYLIVCLALLGTACIDEEGSRQALTNAGFSEISFQGYAAFSCGDDDSSATSFTATNPLGKRVNGVVCCGIWKNCTIRF